MTALLDNDVVLKACRISAIAELLSLLEPHGRLGMLGSARYVLQRRLSRLPACIDRQTALAGLEAILAAVDAVEPNDADLSVAADLQEEAQRTGLPLDGGESQLIAMLLRQRATALLTGDKRALAAAERVLATLGLLNGAAGRIACLEQIAYSLMGKLGVSVLRTRVCADQAVDQALAISFACHSPDARASDVTGALESYVLDLRTQAPILLVPGNDLSGLPT